MTEAVERPSLRIQHDGDASAYLVLMDKEISTEGWVVVGVNPVGERENLGLPGGFTSAYGFYHGHPCWFVEGYESVEVSIPGAEQPFVFEGPG